MGFTTASVLIIGGNSAIAQHLLMLLPDARAIARTTGRPGVTAVGDYARLRPADFAGVGVVINCTGIVHGTEAALRAVNVELQASLAATARAAGAARYVAISSFSIFGTRTFIDRDTPVNPGDAYGRSKRDGDLAVELLKTEGFGTLSVAFPAIIGTTRTGKVERMLRLWRRTRVWPVPSGDVERSMIGARSAAQVLACAAADDRVGRVLAADPIPFRYAAAAQWLRQETGAPFARLPIPPAVARVLGWASPSLHRSMMTSSLLDPDSNYTAERDIDSSLRRELIAAVLGRSER